MSRRLGDGGGRLAVLPCARFRAAAAGVILAALLACSSSAPSDDGVEPSMHSTFRRSELLEDVEHLLTTVREVHPNPYHRADSARIAAARNWNGPGSGGVVIATMCCARGAASAGSLSGELR